MRWPGQDSRPATASTAAIAAQAIRTVLRLLLSSSGERPPARERSRSRAVLTYYDVGNSTLNGFNIIEEIRWLGRARICEVHLKDNPHYLGQGKVDFPRIIARLKQLNYRGAVTIEREVSGPEQIEDVRAAKVYLEGLIG